MGKKVPHLIKIPLKILPHERPHSINDIAFMLLWLSLCFLSSKLNDSIIQTINKVSGDYIYIDIDSKNSPTDNRFKWSSGWFLMTYLSRYLYTSQCVTLSKAINAFKILQFICCLVIDKVRQKMPSAAVVMHNFMLGQTNFLC